MPDEQELESFLEMLWEQHEMDTGGEEHGKNTLTDPDQ